MTHRPTSLVTKDIRVLYGDNAVLQGIDLTVAGGEIMGLVGPNGAGKTTLLRVLSGSLKPQRGEVWVNGAAIGHLPPRERAKVIAMVSQNPTVPQGFTALEVVLMGRNPHLGLLKWEGSRDMEVAQWAMELTSTLEFSMRPLGSLSGGERQRVFLARALAQEAPILLLDEPTAHLDISFQCSVMDTIENVKAQTGVTVVAAMHDLTLAAQYCNRIAALNRGSIVALGCPEDVLRPELVSAAYGTEVAIISHPVHGTPVVLPKGRVRPSHDSSTSPAPNGPGSQ
ncbi:MAG: ABC transporter ATP-binding protein [Chloroflexi bacterium]|nr:ABC transporter ATP-binding protein [Chloroflexota bacterium]